MKLPHCVVIYRLGSLGDTIIALPAFHAVRRAFPESRIILLTNRPISAKAAPVADILGQGYFFDDVLDYPVGTRNPLVLGELLGKIKAAGAEVVVNLTAFRSKRATWRDQWFFRTAGIRQFIGFAECLADGDGSAALRNGEMEWEAIRIARRVQRLGMPDLSADASWDLRLTDAERAEADRLVAKDRTGAGYLTLSIGTKMQAKDWGLDRWLELARRLGAQYPTFTLVMVGADADRERASKCLAAWGWRGVNLCGVTTPRVSAAVLERCRLFVGHDSGPMHLAACVGVRCVAIFSARNHPRQWFPRGGDHHILYNRADCAGCDLEICLEKQKKCLAAITVDQVETAVIAALQTR